MWQRLSSFEPLGLKIIFFYCITQESWFQACLLCFTRTGLDNCLVHQGESNVSTTLTDVHETTCHFPYGLKENVIFILGKLLANLPDCTVEGLVQPTFFTSATEDVVFAAFLIPYKSCEHQSIHSIFVDLTNLQTISRHEISFHNTNVYSPRTASQAQVTRR